MQVEIRVGDITDAYDKLKAILSGVSILVSATSPRLIAEQKEIFRAAKDAGVARVIPSDFAHPGVNGPLHGPVRTTCVTTFPSPC